MKRKYVSNTYLRDIENYILMQFEDYKMDCYTVIKKIISTDKPYISTHTGKDICLQEDGYYMVEYLPKNKNYGVRVFLDDQKNTVSYYIDIIDKIGVDHEKGLYYDDLYLDITIDKENGDLVNVWDEDELETALIEDEEVDQEKYDLAYATLRTLLKEIADGTNMYVNNDHKKYIEENFK